MGQGAVQLRARPGYPRLEGITSSFAMHEVGAWLEEQAEASGEKYTSRIVERLLEAGQLDELWGPAVPREACNPKAVPGTAGTAELLAASLRRAGAGNPFLRPPG